MRSPKKKDSNNLKPLLLLIVFVFLLFGMSFLYRLSSIIKESKFDGQNRFTIEVFSLSQAPDKQLSFVSVDPQTQSVSVVTFFSRSELNNLSLGVPADAYIVTRNNPQGKNVSQFFAKLILEKNSTNLTIIDILRLLVSVSSIPNTRVKLIEIQDTQDASKNKRTENLFLDQTILKENTSIQIVNATGLSGVGNEFSRLVSALGGNVVSVATATKVKNISEMSFFKKKSYTIQRLERMFGFRTQEMKKQGIADIIITLGKDYKNSFR